jgi:acyl-CoA thioester hydrolase
MAFELPIRVYWEDTDAGGIVFYANYLKFFERARTEWLRSLGIAQSRLREDTGGMFVVSQTQVRYLHPARLDDTLRVTARLQEAGRASLVIAQQAFLCPVSPTQSTEAPTGAPPCRSDGATPLVAEGEIRIGWVDAGTLRPARIPSIVLDALHV